MTKKPFFLAAGLAVILSVFSFETPGAFAQQLIHYWNFNNNANQTALLTPSQFLVSGGSITHISGGSSTINVSGGTGQNFDIQNLNARNGDPSGSHLRFDNPIGGVLEFALPTTGYENIVVKFATRRSGSGAGLQYWSYSSNGTSFVPFDTVTVVDGNPVLETLDFSSIAAVNENPDFKIRVAFAAGAGGTVGNNRFDNFTTEGTAAGAQDTTPPATVFAPVHLATNIPVSVNPAITFNEPVRLINNAPITSANASTLVELRLNDENGASVSFTATFSGNTITVIPASALLYNQQYYVALKANMVEDHHDNAIDSVRYVQFETMMEQTVFTQGDMAVVAYRMNAASTEDEIALLTFVDILPGTFINITDAKYTTNAQAQCAGGLIWTSPTNECVPAGSLIYIQPDAVQVNIGTLSGSGFGLSSGGDQVIIYTGAAASPDYITALTSNGWVISNTSCGGSLSIIPNSLADGVSAINASTAPGNVSGNSANAYYNGIQAGTPAQLKAAIFNPANWVAAGSGTAPQTWPNYSFPAPPSITNASVISNNTIRLIFNKSLDVTSAVNVNNYQGIAGLQAAQVTSNGNLPDTVTLTYNTPFASSSAYTLTVSDVEDEDNQSMVCPYVYSFTYNTIVEIKQNFYVVNEDTGTLNVVLDILFPSNASVDMEVLGGSFSTADTNDFTLANQTINITGTNVQVQIPILIIDDNEPEQHAEYFNIVIRNPVNCDISGDTLITVYIKDNDRTAPQPTKQIELDYITSFDPSGSNNSTCEVIVYDAPSKRLITTSAISNHLEIIDFSSPAVPSTIHSIDMSAYGGGITSVSVYNGLIAVAVPDQDEVLDGQVVFMDIDGNYITGVTVGVLPDMVTFSHDGKLVMTANEGQPNNDYSIDPEGSVSIIDLSKGIDSLTQSDVTTLDFTAFNSQEATLTTAGVRKTYAASTLSQDLEPEYITISKDDKTAWVTLQENNAIATIDLNTKTITDIWALGTKNISVAGNGFDVSDNNGEVLIANWPIKAFYIPDAVANFSVNNKTYLITANEGDEKEYATFEERTTVGANNYILDEAAFPNAAFLKKSYNLGRMRVSNLNGDIDNDGDFDEIYCVGSRSFSIWDAENQELVYDSGDDFEMITAMDSTFGAIFNSDHESNSFKGRSRAKGPEPEGVTVGTVKNKIFAFVSLERIGGVMVYDVTSPDQPEFVDYKNARDPNGIGGDLGPETLIFIPANNSPDGKTYLVVANEISGTLTFFEVKDNIVSIHTPENEYMSLLVYPNPVTNIAHFNRVIDFELTDVTGRQVRRGKNASKVDVSDLASGIYIIKASDGSSAKILVQ